MIFQKLFFRSYWNGNDYSFDSDCHVRCYSSKCSKSILHLLPRHLDGNLYHFCVRKYDRVHRYSQPYPNKPKTSSGATGTTDAYCDTCLLCCLQYYLLDCSCHIMNIKFYIISMKKYTYLPK